MSEAYVAVMAAARKSRMLTEQQMIEFLSLKNIEELINRIKDYYQITIQTPLNIERIEEEFIEKFYKEVEEFIEKLPSRRKLLKLIIREFEDERIARKILELRNKEKEYLNKLREMEYDEEIKESENILSYGIPGLVYSIFSKYRILKIAKELKGHKALTPYVSLKIDEHNVITIIRGIKNNIKEELIEKLLILDGGSIDKKILLEIIKTKKLDNLALVLGIPSQKSLRDIEREFEKRMRKILLEGYYKGYGSLEAAIAYIELKKIEIKNLIRILNCINLKIDPKIAIQEYFI
ncbi:MAG: V-type ATPase subunit [Candidatus Methanomethylicaceae archaeon]|nr:V-type ATPase subunit [Candidatus Verstraetearchaeota archaeon]